MLENIPYELRVHTADELLILVEQIVVAARGKVELQGVLVDDGVQSGIVEMFVQCVDLPQRLVAECRRSIA